MTGIAEGDEPEWNFLWGIYKTSSDPIEQQLILYALSRTRQLWVLARYDSGASWLLIYSYVFNGS